MDYRRRFFVYVALAAVVGAVTGATRNIPPLFRENPNARANPEVRAEDNLNYRLPNTTLPSAYTVELTTNVHTGDTAFTGSVTIDLTVVEQTREIVVHARQLTILEASLKSKDNAAEMAQIMAFTYEAEREFLTLTPTNAATVLARDTNWALTIKYKGQLRTDNGGFYLSTYKDENGNTRYLATTQFESTDARHGFPCYDEPAKRAKFTISINHNPSYNAISNMPVDTAKSRSGLTAFETTLNMPTYLIAFIVSDFKWTEGVLNSLPQRIYSRPGTQDDQEWALISGMLLIQRLAEYYDVSFPLPKIDQVAVPDFAAGAMENWGLATYREEYLLYNTDKSTTSTQTNIANIIAHEYTHQWFGNLVAIKWWSYLWLKEGFATLYSYQSADAAYPEWDIYQLFHVSDYQGALNDDASNSPRPMTHYVQKPNEISRLYDSVSYGKAGSVLNMWEHALTDKVFKRGLHNYLTANAYNAAEESQLFEAIQIAAKEENLILPAAFSDMMGSWTRQGGYPVLTVTRNYNNQSFTVKQEAFFNDELHQEEKTWYIPVNYVAASNADFRDTKASHYLLKTDNTISITDSHVSNTDWLIFNKQSTGYYRINYDKNNWNLIVEGLINQPYKIHIRNRAQLMHDAYRFSSSHRLQHSILLKLLTYLEKEDQYAPWATANSIFNVFNRYLSGDRDYENFQSYWSELVNPIYEKLGVNDVSGEQHFQKNTRSIAINLACLAGIRSCLEATNKKLQDFIHNGIPIEPNLQSSTFCNGLRESADSNYDYVYNLLMTSDDQAQRRSLISSLGCSQKESQLQKFVRSSIDNSNSLRVQERTTLLNSAYARGATGFNVCIDFLNDNWETYADLTSGFGGANPLDDDLRGMSRYAVNAEQQKKLQDLVSKVKGSDKVTPTLEQVVQTNIDSNNKWLAQNGKEIMSWINLYTTAGASIATSSISFAIALSVLLMRLM